ncbi:MAG: tRNA uridine-5-carboxymethylaminomethyl(34) synthesis GTPase MnmE [Candidatus Marinimicrobia bacterium]|nr:tRNA uridine-5-carboxymethylaminomethyl(34) synthesis GTPase MnmE [Candidatus Neomarinimicrobiota bacterium]
MDTPIAQDTIAAIASALGPGAIAIVRVSGPQALPLADAVFRGSGRPPSQRPGHSVCSGMVCAAHGEPLDEVLVLIFRAPRSYTCEDVVEFHCHGGGQSARRVLRRALAAGARAAEPGEFTLRAFLNGRLDLTQAEAVQDLIQARSERAADAALQQLRGGLRQAVAAIHEEGLTALTPIEAALDFPDDEMPTPILAPIGPALERAAAALGRLLETATEGRLLRAGVRLVLAGPANAGKSSLFNALLGTERAITSPQPGTTRDTIEAAWPLHGIPITLVDTAGLRAAACAIESDGIGRTRAELGQADLQLLVLDGAGPLDDDARATLAAPAPAGRLIVLNKSDLPPALDRAALPPGIPVIAVSALTGQGLADLRHRLVEMLDADLLSDPAPHAVIAERHRLLLACAQEELSAARTLFDPAAESGWVLVAGHIRAALEALGELSGRHYQAELLDRIFSGFCIGK